MKVLHIHYWDNIGGAAKGMFNLHSELLSQEIDSWILVAHKNSNDKKVIELYNKSDREERKALDSLPKRLYKQATSGLLTNNLLDSPKFLQVVEDLAPDIVHIHWLGFGFCSIEDLGRIGVPIVWSLRDWALLSGGCHHPYKCKDFINGCGKCHLLKSDNPYDFTAQNIKRKKKVLLNTNLTLVGISPHMSNEAKVSFLKDKSIVTINNSIDNHQFYPLNKDKACKYLDIKTTKKIVAIGAISLNDVHKGFDYFVKALEYLKNENIYLLIFGQISDKKLKDINCSYQYFGFIEDENFLRNIYNACDIFVAPSLYEPFGKTIAEAMNCKKPVVAFCGTGGPDFIIDHKINGYLAQNKSSKDLAQGITFLLENKHYGQLAQSAYEKIQREFCKESIAKQYKQLYKQILQKSTSISKFQQNKTDDIYQDILKLTEFQNLINNLKQYSTSAYIIYGYGTMGKVLKVILKEKILFFIDKDYKKIDDLKVYHPSNFPYNNAIILVSIPNRHKEIYKYLKDELKLKYKIINIGNLI